VSPRIRLKIILSFCVRFAVSLMTSPMDLIAYSGILYLFGSSPIRGGWNHNWFIHFLFVPSLVYLEFL